MNHYQTSTPRAACGIAAAVLTAMTIGLAVVLPAKMDAGRAPTWTLTRVKAVTPAVTEGSTLPARIDMHAREPELASRRADGNGAARSAPG